jgi:ribosomal protein L32
MIDAYKKMIIKNRCPTCHAAFGCKHTVSAVKTWQDEEYLATVDLGSKPTDITNPEAILCGVKTSEPTTDTVSKTMTTDANMPFVKCNLCGHEVAQHFLTRHIGLHIENKYIEEATVRVADSIVKMVAGSNFPPIKEELTEVKVEDVRKFLNALPLSKVKDQEDFAFRKLKDVSCFSGTSKDGRYSDFTLLVWFQDISTTSTYNAGFAGGHNSHYGKASERLQLHLTYDSLEKYFTISGRCYKKPSYSDYETEEAAVPDRICDQEELLIEMKRIFLFFKTSPKAVYKRFLKTVRKGSILIENKDSTPQSVTINHVGIMEDLKKAKTSSKVHDSDDYSMYGC